ncbi:paraquat-inducible protein A [Aquitalea sp. LB_tupeE]|uniref:paraquat-inducible protein A n=1 Tax=Aquitalea sp. LB_tupeE TaxID=2748078 RepID=UPI0015B81FA7|nr:paraquat-inducible protein A [Aquitalea sp. LB_tupeE]NWK79098.1 paraquat-inducible protein A [Aquitalea sp. LB_tupeE]
MSRPNLKSAASQGVWRCHACGQLSRVSAPAAAAVSCPRCGASLHQRKPHSLQYAWAFLLAAMLCYIPANLMPIMLTEMLSGTQRDTIMSGVAYLWRSGSWPLALVVFVASVLVPLLKILSMLLLLLTVHWRSRWAPRQRTRLYRLLEVVGPWSMLDIYVVGLLVALVQLQSLATIKAGPGAIAFGAVVVLTMLSAMHFDPRLIWDVFEDDDER